VTEPHVHSSTLRYAITYRNIYGGRSMFGGRHIEGTTATRQESEDRLAMIKEGNTPGELSLYPDLRVMGVQCCSECGPYGDFQVIEQAHMGGITPDENVTEETR